DAETRSACLAGAAAQQSLKDPAGGFALARDIPDPVARAQSLAQFSPGPPGPDAAALVDGCAAAARGLMADYRRAGAPAALGAVLRRLAVLDERVILSLIEGAPEADRWRDVFANHLGPVDAVLAEKLSPEIGRYWAAQAMLRRAQVAAEQDPQTTIRQIEGPQDAAAPPDPLYRSHALAAAGLGLALRDPQSAVGLGGQIADVEE